MSAIDAAASGSHPRHIEAVASVIGAKWADGDDYFIAAHILASTDPAVHAAMLDALTRHGVLTEETRRANLWGNRYQDQRRLVAPWERAS